MTTVQSDAPSQVLFCGGELSAVAHPSIQKKDTWERKDLWNRHAPHAGRR